MKSTALVLLIAAGLLLPGTATAGEEDLAQKSGCLMCHAVDAKKMGPSFKEVAAKFKGKSEAEALHKWKEVKSHSVVKASTADVSAVLKWVLTLK